MTIVEGGGGQADLPYSECGLVRRRCERVSSLRGAAGGQQRRMTSKVRCVMMSLKTAAGSRHEQKRTTIDIP